MKTEELFKLAEKLADEAYGDKGVYLYSERQELTSRLNNILQSEFKKLPSVFINDSLPTREQISFIIDDSLGCERFNCKGRGTCTQTVGTTYICKAKEREIDLLLKLFTNDRQEIIENSKVVGKYIIVKDLNFSDFMKDEQGKIKTYDTLDDTHTDCGMYEFEDVLVMKVEFNHVEAE